MPDAEDVRAHAVEERGEVGDLRLARRVLDDGLALGEHRRGHQVLGRADAREVEDDARAASACCSAPRRSRATTSSSAPMRLQAAEVHVELAAPDVVAAGQRDARLAAAREQRAEHVDRRPHPADEVVGRLGGQPARRCRCAAPRGRPTRPRRRRRGSTSIITSRSATGGRLRTTVTPGASKAAASCFSPEFFVAPETLIVPESGGPGRTATASIGPPRLVPVAGPTPVSGSRTPGGRCSTKAAIASFMSSDGRHVAWPSASMRRPSTIALVERRVDRALRGRDRERRLRGDALGELLRGLVELLVGDELLARGRCGTPRRRRCAPR